MKNRKQLPIPNIDRAGILKVIDDSGKVPMWETIATGFVATTENAKRIMREKGIKAAWMFDGFEKVLITI